VKYKRHAGIKVLLSTTKIRTYLSPALATSVSDFISSAEFLVQFVVFSIFAFSAVSPGNFFFCAIYCSAISIDILLSLCSDFMFQIALDIS